MKKIKNKKLVILQLVIIFTFLFFLIFINTPKNYEKDYEIKDVLIKERYDKKLKAYFFNFEYKDVTFSLAFKEKYQKARKLVKDIEIIEDGNDFCLKIKGDFKFGTSCVQDGEIIYAGLSNLINENEENKLIKTYNNIDIYNNDYIYLIWNYNGFYYINKDNIKKIDLFERELYNLNNVYYTNDYLVVPSIDKEYYFNKFYTINYKKGKVNSYNLKYDIYFDNYTPGYIKNNLYLVDNKEGLMYKFNTKKGKIEKIKPVLYNKGKLESVSINSLINKEKKFIFPEIYNYELENDNLYLTVDKVKMLVSQNVKGVVKLNEADAFYIVGDSLYHFSPMKGEELLIKYYELNFNYNNIIYIW